MNAQVVTVTSDVMLTDSAAYFPQLSDDGKNLIYAPTDAHPLIMQDVATGATRIVSDKGLPGFDAVFDNKGNIVFMTIEQRDNRLLYRGVSRYDVKKGKIKQLLKPQHGAVHIVKGTKGLALVGESKSRDLKKAGTVAWTQGDRLMISVNGKVRQLRPVQGTVGLLWASVSPDGTRVAFEAATKGVYVCDLDGNHLTSLGMYLMPCWYNNDYLVAMSNAGNIRISGSNIHLLKADGSFAQPLTDSKIAAIQPMVSGDKIVFTTKAGVVHVMTLSIQDAMKGGVEQ
ncbi:MAG: hypothetical protein II603_03965 [Muribaculaceae bacterium]|nr:hypothetical protein [Muribaculaceae bacterium]